MVDTSEGEDVVSASAIVASVTSSVLAEATGFRGHRATIAAGSLSSTGPEHAGWIRTYLVANPSWAILDNRLVARQFSCAVPETSDWVPRFGRLQHMD